MSTTALSAADPSPTAPRGPRTARGRATRDRIVEATAALVHERGPAATSLDDVRSATGTSKSQLYHYFPDKAALLHAVVEAQSQRVVGGHEQLLGGADSLAALRGWRDQVVDLVSAHGPDDGCPLGCLAAEVSGTDEHARADLAAAFTRWRAALSEVLTAVERRGDLLPGADPERLALGLLGAVQGGLLLARVHRSTAPLEAALDVALAGVAAAVRP